jgi:hypothetical protein
MSILAGVLYWVSFNLLFAALLIWRRVIARPSADRWRISPLVRVIDRSV